MHPTNDIFFVGFKFVHELFDQINYFLIRADLPTFR